MKGTEKQIAWAERIKKVIIDTANEAYSVMVNDQQFDSNNPAHVAMAETYKNWAELAEKEESASFFIDTFSRVNASEPLVKRIKSIRAAIVVSPTSKEWR